MNSVKKLFCFILINQQTILSSRKEVAVIIGGKYENGTEQFDVEVFTDLSDSCAVNLYNLNAKELFKYPGPSTNTAGLYLDNLGMFVCGGLRSGVPETGCYYLYNPVPDRVIWAKFDYETGTDIDINQGILDTGMEVWDFDTGELGFYQVGGQYDEIKEPSMISTYKYKHEDTVINSEPNNEMPYPRSGHCFVRVKASDDGRYKYMAIGGQTSPEDTAPIFYNYCSDTDCTNWNWEFAEFIPELDHITGHSCVVFEETDDNGDMTEVVLVAGGEDENAMRTFTLSSFCDTISHTCDWIVKDQTSLPQSLSHSKMTTLDGIPYIFGGNDGTLATNVIYKFESGVWIELSERMSSARQNHLVIAVPEDWLCYGTFTTSSSTSTTTKIPTEISTTLSDSSSTSSLATFSTATEASTTPICPNAGNCSKMDMRGVLWEGKFENWILMDCSEGTGTARWFCNGCLQDYEGSQPDRSECVAGWVLDIGNMIEDTKTSSMDVSEIILENTKPASEDDPGITGGSIVTLVNLYSELLTKHEHEDGDTEDNKIFTSNIITTTSVLIKLECGWNEIQSESLRFQTSSNILVSMDNIGYMFGKSLEETKSECVEDEHVFVADNVNLNVRTISSTDTDLNTCFTFDNLGSSGSICLPEADLGYVENQCSIQVASSVSIDPEKSNIFPESFSTRRRVNKSILGDNLIGLTIDNGSIPIQLPEHSLPIVVTFVHEDSKALYENRTCIFWDVTGLSWSTEGCQFSPIDSDDYTTVCNCRHLTNFGIMFDYTGNADPADPLLSIISIVLLILSSLAILATQALLFFLKSDKRSSTRKLAENNRNWTLFAAQIAFVALAGQQNNVSDDVCQFFGALIHLLYLSFFAWTVLEGYFFYRALVTVFDTNRLSSLLHYSIGYGVPLLIMIITLVISEAGGDTLYLRRNNGGDVVACWLDVDAMPAIVVPGGIVLFINLCVTVAAIYIAHKAGIRRNISSKSRILGTMRNTILLSLLLGLTWITALIPTSSVQQYITVILNASTGLYILAYSVLANRQVRGEVRERVSGRVSKMVSTYVSTGLHKEGSESDKWYRKNNSRNKILTRVGTDNSKSDS